MRFVALLLALLVSPAALAESPRSVAVKVVRAARWRQGQQPFVANVNGRVFEARSRWVIAFHKDGLGFTAWESVPAPPNKVALAAKGIVIRKAVRNTDEALRELSQKQQADAYAKQVIDSKRAQQHQDGLMRRYFESAPPDASSQQMRIEDYQSIVNGHRALQRGKGGTVTLPEGTPLALPGGQLHRLKQTLTAPIVPGDPRGPRFVQLGNQMLRIPYLVL